MNNPPIPTNHRQGPPTDGVEVFVWPHHALNVLFALILIAVITYVAWEALRGEACNRCGRDRGLCPHTRDEFPGGEQ